MNVSSGCTEAGRLACSTRGKAGDVEMRSESSLDQEEERASCPHTVQVLLLTGDLWPPACDVDSEAGSEATCKTGTFPL